MTVSTGKSTASGLREVAAALQGAETALGCADKGATHEALLALARASYESLSNYEQASVPAPRPEQALQAYLAQWRRELDEARVQLALAEMEARDAGAEVAKVIAPIFDPMAERIGGAVREILGTLSDLRRGLTDRAL